MHVVRSGGKYAREQQRFYEVKAAAFAFFGTILFILPIPHSWFLGLIFFGLGLYYLRRSRNWSKGIQGEKMVVDVLTTLDNSHVLINDVVLSEGGGNIDHILVGPNGVFVIETKSYIWSYLNRFPIRQVIRNSVSLRCFLKEHLQLDIFVHALLTTTDPNATMLQSTSIFHIRSIDNLCAFIREYKSRSVLDHKKIKDVVYEILRVAKLKESGINPYRGLLKPVLVFGAILLVYTLWTLSAGNPYGKMGSKGNDIQPPSESVGRIIGNKKSKIYHLPGQVNYGKVKEESQIYFTSEEEAIRSGYRKGKEIRRK